MPKLEISGFQIHPNVIRQIMFLCILLFMGYLIADGLYFMISSFLGAITFYVILMYPMKYLVIYKRWPSWLAALVLMLISLFVMVIPFIYLTTIAISRLMPVVTNPAIINDVFKTIHDYLLSNYNIDVLNAENIQMLSGHAVPIAQKALGGTFSTIGMIFLMYLILYFMLVDTRKLEHWLNQTLPFKRANVKTIISEIRNLVYSNALGIPIVALIQGVAGVIGYWIFGVEEFLIMGIMTAISSVIPVIGTMTVYLPLAVYQFIVGGSYEGIGVALWGFIVIGGVDNVARFLVQKKLADVHPLITLLGVFLGINLFGFIGLIFGPLLISVFFILLRIYIDEFGKSDEFYKT
ncbi:MAG TPA: AI-2E family transporter [Saprospiraceae bacterium]|nr:AI-2E family transporter [Saprospiraceae bacterium]HRP42715.1 AI-2E family transporter [Saprospiraceae bacterium]